MRIIEIIALDNGAHRNQTTSADIAVPAGWAIIPDDMETPNFPFGEITIDASNPPIVTSWIPGVMPEPEPEPEDVPDPQADTDAMLIDHEMRLTMLELGI